MTQSKELKDSLYSNDIDINRIYWHSEADLNKEHKFVVNFDIALDRSNPEELMDQFNIKLNKLRAVYPEIDIDFQRASVTSSKQEKGNVIPLKITATGSKL